MATREERVNSLIPMISSIHDLMRDCKFETLDAKMVDLIKTLAVDDTAIAMTYLRTTFIVRSRIKNWVTLRDALAEYYETVGRDSAALLMGLYQPIATA